jgi:hypothetical protein
MPGCPLQSAEIVRDEPCCRRHAILRRAGWQCEAIIPDRRPWVDGFVRCPVMGSEISVVNGEARCPRHGLITGKHPRRGGATVALHD